MFCRRFVWNFFRLENEHLNNCGNFRAVRDISVKPVNTDIKAELTIEKLMDDEHGPLPKRRMVSLLLSENNKPESSHIISDGIDEKEKDNLLENVDGRTDNGSLRDDSSSSGDNDEDVQKFAQLKVKSVFSRSTVSVVEEANGLVYNNIDRTTLHYNDNCPAVTKDVPNPAVTKDVPNLDDGSSLPSVNVIVHKDGRNTPEREAIHNNDDGRVLMDTVPPVQNDLTLLDDVVETAL